MTPNSSWRLLGVATLLLGYCWPAYGQTSPETKPSKPADAQAAYQLTDFTCRLVANALGQPKAKPISEEGLRNAIDRFTERLNQNPNDVELLIARAGARILSGETKDAEADATKAVNVAPNNSTAWYVYAQTKINVDADTAVVKEGIAALKKAHDLGFNEPDLFFELGNAWHQIGDTRRAIASFSKAIDKNVSKAYFPRAMLRNETGDTLLAIADFDKVIELGAAAYVDKSFAYCERGRAHRNAGHVQEAIRDYTKAIEESPNPDSTPVSALAYIGRAMLYDATENWEAAIRDFNRGIELEPSNAEYTAYRGCAYIAHQKVKEGIADIRKAIELNPGDLGASYKPLTEKSLSPEALAHGEKQVRKMLKDRPEMAAYVVPGDMLWTWTARKFAGEDLGELIDWNSDRPIGNRGAYYWSVGKANAYVQAVLEDQSMPDDAAKFEQLWTVVVFELHNVLSTSEMKNIRERTDRGDLDCDQYVIATCKAEVPAAQRTRAFYIGYYLTWLEKSKLLKTSPLQWFCTAFTEIPNPKDDHRPYTYAYYFNSQCGERELNRKDYAKAREFVKRIFDDKNNLPPEAMCEAHCLLGHINRDAGDFDEAIKDFTRSIEINPKSVSALSERAFVYLTHDREKDAIADLNKAMLLEPSNGDLYLRRAWAKGNLFDVAGSIEDFSKSLDLAPENPLAFQGRAKMYASHGEKYKAISDYGTAIKLNPKDGAILCERGWVHFHNNDPRRAIDDFSAAIKLMPNSSMAYANRAEALLRTNDPALRSAADAMKDAERACELCEWKSAYEISVLSEAYLIVDDFDNAVKWKEKALSLSNEAEREAYAKDLESLKQRQKERK